jgi:hypothetical protein
MSSAFVSYFDLKDPKKPLPPSAKFLDPYDNTMFMVEKGENLADLTKRVELSREKKGFPAFDPADLRTYIVTSLAETCNQEDLQTFFHKKTTLPEFNKAVSLARTIIRNRLTTNESSFDLRMSRTNKCLSCPLHVARSAPVPHPVVKAIEKLTRLDEILISDDEKKLGSCGMCGCDLKTKIRLSLMGAIAALTPEELRTALLKAGNKLFDGCWILNESLQDARLKNVLESKVRNSGPKTADMLNSYFAEKSERFKRGEKKV